MVLSNKKRKQKLREATAQVLLASHTQNNFSIKNVLNLVMRTITSNIYQSKQNLEHCTKVCVEGVPFYSSEDDIRSYFQGCGTITEIDCINCPETGNFRGVAIITFKTEAAAKRALLLDGSDMGGLYLKIQSYKSERANKASPFTPDSAKIRRRTCYECGEKGHLASACPTKQPTDQANPVTFSCQFKCEDSRLLEENTNTNQPNSNGINEVAPVPDSSKIRRRICYECGEKGHLASACPEKQLTGAVTISNQLKCDYSRPLEEDKYSNQPNSNGTNEAAPVPDSLKIRRRTCYECREKGHLSSACPKKQRTDQANPVMI